jgi:hypothetical protein
MQHLPRNEVAAVRSALSTLDQPSNHTAAFIVRWRWLLYLLLLLAALAIAGAESKLVTPRPVPQNVEAED